MGGTSPGGSLPRGPLPAGPLSNGTLPKVTLPEGTVPDGAVRGRTLPDGIRADWIAVDWGTSNLRVWAMDDSANILAAQSSPLGMNAIAADDQLDFETVLLGLVDGWLAPDARDVPVVICGMAGARQGWCEAPYCTVPVRAEALSDGAVRPVVADPRLAVSILPGVRQLDDADVMRGEETQLVGFMAGHAGFVGWVCLPGTHSKWARIEGDRITGFRTYMSGEVFDLLSRQSILRHSVSDEWDDRAFEQAVRDVHARPGGFLHRLFTVRAGALVAGADAVPAPGAAVLSGTVIGTEISDVLGLLKSGDEIALIGEGRLATLYQAALAVHGHRAVQLDGTAITLAGLCRARKVLAR